ncbi:OmpA family protein [Pedobacter heparinus]|uniref:OmpA/MotB domain protein n=1 Tax=Pedobacter heparinus (strain ATCC 13125 / DSM 2366 / CIP 104194 / JCM 7457 / NBRC 12017 / NCIMB 9290 / NRRL B-14731 / HIM 762-3) TaxID=485917 RepID=C6XY68_PEDHD|nr:OmpA family protein [Pedobacter heparinus]ACU02335.1 OmpA/MotB domain protein [Pedobacter heparinus DSM 2366]
MKRTLPLVSTISILLLNLGIVQAQYILKEADQQFDLFNYDKAINLYTQAYKKKATLHTAERLAEAYQLKNDYLAAESWYALAARLPGSKNENTLYYAMALQQNAKYSEAKAQYLNYFAKENTISSVIKNNLLASCDSAENWMKNPAQIQVNNLGALNGPQSDWGSVIYQDAMVFASDRINIGKANVKAPFLKFDGTKFPDRKIYGWTGSGYLKLYTQHGADSVRVFPVNAKTNYHIGAASFTADENTMYFTLTRIPEKPGRGKDNIATINVEIYSSKKNAGKWEEAIPFKYNKADAYSVGDPFISKDGNRLYFVSDMPGGLGGTDIYYVEKLQSGEWGDAVNLQEVNSAGNERCPFVANKNTFYFSSDGRIGMGGLDIFRLSKNATGENKIENLGFPVNSPQDDFAFNTDVNTGISYFSSNRFGGKGSDDIYSMERQVTNSPVLIAKEPTDPGTLNKKEFLQTKENNKPIRLENIYYDFNKWDIRADAAAELEKLVQIMKDNSRIWIELGSHTDSRGNDAYNFTLSQKRAESAVTYMISRGIEKNRIEARGYGETLLLNRCANGIKCTEEEHQLNRRTEFKITAW